jgi:hypothetical protein
MVTQVSVRSSWEEWFGRNGFAGRARRLFMRMGMRRFTRLTNGFSKKFENHAAMVAIHAVHYNFARIHKT